MSVVTLPKLKINPASDLSAEEQATRLHFRKNRPERPELEDMEFPPYTFMPYPQAMYRKWTDANKLAELRRIAGRLHLSLSDPHEYQVCVSELPEYESKTLGQKDMDFVDGEWRTNQQLRDHNDAEHRIALGQGWADTPEGVKEAEARINREIFTIAAHTAYEDRNMSDPAKSEREMVEESGEDHILEVTPEAVKAVKEAKKGKA